MEKLKKQRSTLIESLGVYFEQERQLAPLAARIFATLILNGTKGTTFEELVTELEASKSTVSTHLTTLEALKSIVYFTKCGDRKRYYAPKPGYIVRKIDTLITQWEKEIGIHEQILGYKKHFNTLSPEVPLSTTIHKDALEFLTGTVSHFKQLKSHFHLKEEKQNAEL